MKYLMPGLLFLLALQVWPIVYTVGTAFTNFGDGHRISKQESIDSIIANSVQEVPGSSRYKLTVAVKEGADIATAPPVFLLTDPKGKTLIGDASGLEDLTGRRRARRARSARSPRPPDYTILNARQVNARKDLATFAVPTPDGGGIKRVGLSEAFEGKPSVSYDKATDTLTDSATKKVSTSRGTRSGCRRTARVRRSRRAGRRTSGSKNFTRVLTDDTLRTGFVKIFVWNMFFAVFSVLSTFLLGMLLALLLNDPRLKGKAIYRLAADPPVRAAGLHHRAGLESPCTTRTSA